MKSRRIAVFSAVISTVYAAAVVFFVCSLAVEFSRGHSRVSVEFDSLESEVSDALDRFDPLSEEFARSLDDSCAKSVGLSALSFKKNGEVLYATPNAESIGSPSRLCEDREACLAEGCSVSARLYLLRPSAVFRAARIVFAVVLAATLATLAVILGVYFSDGGGARDSLDEGDESDDLDELDSIDSSEGDEIEKIGAAESEAVAQNAAPDGAEIEKGGEGATDSEGKTDAEDETEKSKSGAVEAGGEAEGSADAALPQDLALPAICFGDEKSLEQKLGKELERAASLDQDLSVFLIRIPTLPFEDETSKKICSMLMELFQHQELLFSFKNDGYAVIKSDVSVDSAVKIADNIYSLAMQIIAQSGRDLRCFIGVSTRAIRLMSADRLLAEALEAQKRAQEEGESPIVAFRADVNKYRQFIKQN